MKRKTSIAILTAIIALACHTQAFADNSHINNGGNGGGNTIVIQPTKPKSPAPKAPSRQQIECSYDGSILYLNFTYGEGEAELTVTDHTNGDIFTYGFSTDAPASIMIGDISSAHIAITTALGNSYEGFIE